MTASTPVPRGHDLYQCPKCGQTRTVPKPISKAKCFVMSHGCGPKRKATRFRKVTR